jgi:iron(III) transport system substrate-binding protein
VAGAGSYPALTDVGGPTVPSGAPVVTPDWASVAAGQEQMLAEYQQVFGG